MNAEITDKNKDSNKKKPNWTLRWCIRVIIVFVLSIVFYSSGISCRSDNNPMDMIMAIIGIMMPIAVSQSLSFPFDDVDNEKFIDNTKNRIDYINKCFVGLLMVAAFLYIRPYPELILSYKWLRFSLYYFSDFFIIFILVYYCFNFLALIKEREKLSNCLRDSRISKQVK